MEWKDVTSYSRGDKERKPTAWQIEHEGLVITVVWNHRDRPNEWVFHCYQLGFDTFGLTEVGATTLEEAKAQAIRHVIIRASCYLKAAQTMQGEGSAANTQWLPSGSDQAAFHGTDD